MRLRTVALIGFCIIAPNGARAQCELGKDVWVNAINNFSVHARWNASAQDEQVYNPPPGYVIAETRLEKLSEHWGSAGVSVVASNSRFAVSGDFSSATQYLLDLYGRYGYDSGRLKAQQSSANWQSFAKHFDATHNTVVAQISASGSGNFFDQQSGWMEVSVKVRLICIGSANTSELALQLAKAAGLPTREDIRELIVENHCNENVRLAVQWRDLNNQDREEYWWVIGPGGGTALKSKDGGIVASRLNRIPAFMIYAEGEASSSPKTSRWGNFSMVIDGHRYPVDRAGDPVKLCR